MSDDHAPIFLSAPLQFAAGDADSDTPRSFTGTAYSGGLVPDRDMVVDLATARTPASLPILYQHDQNKPIGLTSQIDKSNQLTVSGQIFSAFDEDAKNVALKAKAGFPYQMSIGIWDGDWDFYGKNADVTVNGQTFSGPVDVIRNAHIREVSIVALGADPNTNTSFFSQDTMTRAVQLAITQLKKEETSMPDSNDPTAELNQRIAALETELETVKGERDTAQASLTAQAAAVRLSAVKALFDKTGIEFSDETAAPYLEMSAEHFTAAEKAIPAKPSGDNGQQHDQSLFTDQANDSNTNQPVKKSLDFSAIYEARNNRTA